MGKDPNFRFITLREPPKKQTIRFLEAPCMTTRPARCARVQIILRTDQNVNELYELMVDLDKCAVTQQHLLKGKHSYIEASYMKAVEQACLANEDVQNEIDLLELPAEGIVTVEAWAYATDGMNDMSERTTMVRTAK